MTTNDINLDEKLKALKQEFEATKSELQEILLDIRAYILEAHNPMRWPKPAVEDTDEGESTKEVTENGGR